MVVFFQTIIVKITRFSVPSGFLLRNNKSDPRGIITIIGV